LRLSFRIECIFEKESVLYVKLPDVSQREDQKVALLRGNAGASSYLDTYKVLFTSQQREVARALPCLKSRDGQNHELASRASAFTRGIPH